jgi:outer membrane protein assembly factor BamB
MKNQFQQFLLITAFLSQVLIAQSQTVAQWRGINRDGIYQEANLLKTWPAEGPQLLWETEAIGHGYGSPVVWNNKLYINGEIDSISHLFAFDLQGNLLWKTPNGPEFIGTDFSAGFPGSRSTPTVYEGKVYISSGLGRMACIDAETGKEIWSKHMVTDLGGALNYFGYCESLVVDGNWLYCFPGGQDANVVCLDRLTGNTVWTSKAMADLVAFTSPMMIKLPSRSLFVTISKNYLFALDAKNGELLWSFKEDSVKMEGQYTNTPLYDNGFIYGVSGVDQGKGAYKLQLSPDGASITEKWVNNKVKNETGGFVKVNNKLYVTTQDKKLKALDIETGAVVDSLRNMRGSLIFADNRFFCYNDNGNVDLIALENNQLKTVSKFKITKGTKEHLAHPVIDKGILYIRHGKVLQAYKVK